MLAAKATTSPHSNPMHGFWRCDEAAASFWFETISLGELVMEAAALCHQSNGLRQATALALGELVMERQAEGEPALARRSVNC